MRTMRRIVFCLPSLSVALGVPRGCGLRQPHGAPRAGGLRDRRGAGPGRPPRLGARRRRRGGVRRGGRGRRTDAPKDVQFRDVPVLDICPDAGSTLIYVLAEDNTLLSFYPPTLGFTRDRHHRVPGRRHAVLDGGRPPGHRVLGVHGSGSSSASTRRARRACPPPSRRRTASRRSAWATWPTRATRARRCSSPRAR